MGKSEKLHPISEDGQEGKGFQTRNDLNIWYQFTEKIEMMSREKVKGESMEKLTTRLCYRN